MKTLKLTWAALDRSLAVLSPQRRVVTLRVLKEAAIYDQSFTAAWCCRDRELQLVSKSRCNAPQRKRRATA